MPEESHASSSLPKDFIEPVARGAENDKPVPSEVSPESSLDELLIFARHQGASDIHVSAERPLLIRRFGVLEPRTEAMFPQSAVERIVKEALDEEDMRDFHKQGDLELVYCVDGHGRFRVTLMKQRRGWDFTARVIPTRVRPFEESGLPPACLELIKWPQGLILVTGPAGCGKTATLSTLVETINQTRNDHIILIEDPIEVLFEPKECQITQRQIHRHTLSQANALRAALREDPDILVISELRDLQSIQIAVTAAETGHLVLGSMNTNNAAQTISTLIDSFPPEEQSIITNMISESLRGVISQQLLPRADGSGMIPAYELLVVTPAVANMIRERKIQAMNNAMTTGKAAGMVLLDNSLLGLVQQGLVSVQEAACRAVNPMTFAQYTPGEGGGYGKN